MDISTHITNVIQEIESAFDKCDFEKDYRIELGNTTINPALYEQNNKLVIFIRSKPSDELNKTLINKGYVPLEYLPRSNKNITEHSACNKAILDSPSQAIGGYKSSDKNTKDQGISANSPQEYIEHPQEEINDLIGKTPGWLLHSGITIIAFVIITLIIFSSFIKYPDKIISTGVITSSNPPSELFSKINSRVEKVLIPSGHYVNRGDRIIYLNNTADLESIRQVKDLITSIDLENTNQVLRTKLPQELSLGKLQDEYGQLHLKFKEYQQVLKSLGIANQINNIKEEIQNIGILNQSITKEKSLYQSERALIEKDLDRQIKLYEEGLVSQVDLEDKRALLNKFDRNYETLEKSRIQTNIRQEALESDILRLREDRTKEIQKYQFSLAGLFENMRMAIIDWEAIYFIKASKDGIVELSDDIKKKPNLSPQTIIGYVIPNEAEQKYARLLVPPQRKGEISIGNKCLIKLDAYPYKQYGLIISEVSDFSKLSTKSLDVNTPLYEVIVPLQDSLITEYGERIEFIPNMSFQAEIITEDKSFLSRIMNKFFDLIKNS